MKIKITFEDHGQDFLWWVIDTKTGKIIDCGPFQAWVWCEQTVDQADSLKIGDRPLCKSGAGYRRLNYAITQIE
ncbi:MAG: hypothetical protein AAGF10_05350, partial [Verrucomicrobiota bacterium]